MGVAKTLAYYDMAKIKTLKSFSVKNEKKFEKFPFLVLSI
jgi:hypothetical protein